MSWRNAGKCLRERFLPPQTKASPRIFWDALSVSDVATTSYIFFCVLLCGFLIYLFYFNKEDAIGKTFLKGWQFKLTPKQAFPQIPCASIRLVKRSKRQQKQHCSSSRWEQKEAKLTLSVSENDTIDFQWGEDTTVSAGSKGRIRLFIKKKKREREHEQVEAKRLLRDANELSRETSPAPKTNSESALTAQSRFQVMSHPPTGQQWAVRPGTFYDPLLCQATAHPWNQKVSRAKWCFKTPVRPPQGSSSKYCSLPVTIRTIWKCSSWKNTLFFVVTGV